jgi:hypothetical protein
LAEYAMQADPVTKQFLLAIASKGGKSKSPAKLRHAMENLRKINLKKSVDTKAALGVISQST